MYHAIIISVQKDTSIAAGTYLYDVMIAYVLFLSFVCCDHAQCGQFDGLQRRQLAPLI